MPPIASESSHHSESTRCATIGCEQSQQTAQLFDYLVGAGDERRRHVQAERLCCLHVDHQFVLRRYLHWKVSRLLALENAIGLWRIVTESLPFSSA